MAMTDGYVTDSSGGDWKYANLGGPGSGDIGSVTADAYVRTYNSNNPGSNAGGGGGVTVDYTNANWLATVPTFPLSETGPFIPWAGVSPMSLNTALIVWSQPIHILDKSKIGASGIKAISVNGRLMSIQFDDKVSIDGAESFSIQFGKGAVIAYGGDDFAATSGSLSIQVKCTTTFQIEQCYLCGNPAPIWAVCQNLQGANGPTNILPLDKLATLDPSDVTPSRGYFMGVLASGAVACGSVTVRIMGTAGPDVTLNATWDDTVAGFPGMAVQYIHGCGMDCNGGEGNVARPEAGEARCWVGEDIIKPMPRTIPVSFFDEIVLTQTEVIFPSTVQTVTLQLPTEIETLPDFPLIVTLETDPIDVLTDIQVENIPVITDLNEIEFVALKAVGPLDNLQFVSDGGQTEAIIITALGVDSVALLKAVGTIEPVTIVELFDVQQGTVVYNELPVAIEVGLKTDEILLTVPQVDIVGTDVLLNTTPVIKEITDISTTSVVKIPTESPADFLGSVHSGNMRPVTGLAQVTIVSYSVPDNSLFSSSDTASFGVVASLNNTNFLVPSVPSGALWLLGSNTMNIEVCIGGSPTTVSVITSLITSTVVATSRSASVVTTSQVAAVTNIATRSPSRITQTATGVLVAPLTPYVSEIERVAPVGIDVIQDFTPIVSDLVAATAIITSEVVDLVFTIPDLTSTEIVAYTAIPPNVIAYLPIEDPQSVVIDLPDSIEATNVDVITDLGTTLVDVITGDLRDATLELTDTTHTDTEFATYNLQVVTDVLSTNIIAITELDIRVTDLKIVGEVEQTEIVLPSDQITQTAIIIDPDGDITMISVTDPSCDAKFKFLNHDGEPLKFTAGAWSGDCCNGGPMCMPSEGPAEEEDCSNFFLLSGNYTLADKGTAETCYGFTCTGEPDCEGPDKNIANNGGLYPCITNVKRIRRTGRSNSG